MDFSKFNSQIDKKQMKADYDEALKNGGSGDFPELPDGTYEVTFENIEIGATGAKSKNPGSPMLKIAMRVQGAVDCEGNDDALDYFDNYKGKKKPMMFFNRVLFGTNNDASMIAGAVTLLNKLEPDPLITWNYDYDDLSEQIMDLAEDVCSGKEKTDGLWAEVKYEKDAFNSVQINEVFEN